MWGGGLHKVSFNSAQAKQMDLPVCLFVGLHELDAWPTPGLREEWVQVLIAGKTIST